MKIGPIDSKPVAAPAPAERKSGAAPSAGSAAEASAQVELSSQATALSETGADPTFDSAKVERIATAISKGEFRVDADAIADKLIENAQELLGRRPS